MRTPVALIVLDGWGICDDASCNAISLAKTDVFNRLWATRPRSLLRADGEAVGLMPGQMGDSNVGHLNLGAGRIVYQDLTRISKAITDGEFFRNSALLKAMEASVQNNVTLHLMGLLSDGGVHSHEEHLYALLHMAKQNKVPRVLVHCFLDGRDVPPKSALAYIENLEQAIRHGGIGRIASVSGRYYAMDRDKRWERVQKAYDALVMSKGVYALSAREAVETAYERGEKDEFVLPSVIAEGPNEEITIRPGDSVIFFNFRADRARQITRALIDPDLSSVARPRGAMDLTYVGMAQYDETLDIPTAYPPQRLANILGEVISKQGLRQLRIAETEKYAHVTFFFNGMIEEPFPGEERVLVPSPEVATYDLKPEMSAPEVAREAAWRIRARQHDCVILNFANADMVGHTGSMNACMQAVEAVDNGLGLVIEAIFDVGGAALIVSDHGNAEQMTGEEGGPHTAHTMNPVPCILVDDQRPNARLQDGILGNVAPTLLELIGLDKPKEMDQDSLIIT